MGISQDKKLGMGQMIASVIIDGSVTLFASLPDPTLNPGALYLVTSGSGVYLIARKPAGLYLSDGTNWNYLGRLPETFFDSNFKLVNAADNTKVFRFDGAALTTGNTRVISVADYDYDLEKPAVDLVQLAIAHSPAGEPEGQIWWNGTDFTANVATGLGPVIRVGQEVFLPVYNDTIAQIDNGSVVHTVDDATGGLQHIEEADASSHDTLSRDIFVAAMDIPASQMGLATKSGKVRGLDTQLFSVGDNVWVDTTAGQFTKTEPEFPNYSIRVGVVVVSDASVGILDVDIDGSIDDTILDAWDGSIREPINFTVTSNGTVVTGVLENNDGVNDLTILMSDGFSTFDVTPGAEVTLTAGSATIPQTNYVFIDKATKTLQKSTTAWPTTYEHVKVAQVSLLTAAYTEVEGALRNQNWNDMIKSSGANGHFLHITDRIRQEDAKWDTGCSCTVDVVGASVYVKSEAGVVYQLHRQAFPVLDMNQYGIDALNQGNKTFTLSGDGDLTSVFPDGRYIKVNGSTGNDGLYIVASTVWSTPNFIITVEEAIVDATVDGTIGDDIHVVNHDTTPYLHVLDLTTVTDDAGGVALSNTSYSIVVWGIMNRTGQPSHLMANLPTNTYNKNFPDTAVADATNYSVYSIPKAFQGVGFLLARFTFVNTAGTWVLYDTEDLRGYIPNTTAGGGAGGAGMNSLVEDITPQLGGALDCQAFPVGFTQQTVTYSSGTTTVDWGAGNKAKMTFGAGNITTFAFTDPAKPGNFLIVLVQDGTGSRVVTAWDADILWAGGSAPTLSTGAAAVDIVSFYWDGTSYHGVASLDFS